jgi:hypothetical protein
MDPTPDAPNPPQGLDVDVQEIAGGGPLVSLHGCGSDRGAIQSHAPQPRAHRRRGMRNAVAIAQAGSPCCSRSQRIKPTANGGV